MKRIETYVPLTQEQIEKAQINSVNEWKKFLSQYGIIYPKVGTAKYYQLIYLYHFKGYYVHKNVVTQFVQSKIPTASGDQQVRHLANSGFYVLVKSDLYKNNITPSGYYCLVNMTEPKAAWLTKKEFRINNITFSTFDKLKQQYGNCCATCGEQEGKKHKYYDGIVELQKGHMNPMMPLEEGNIIPQCQYCNRDIYKDNFVFNEQGRPVSINNPRYILKSSKEVREKMYELLRDEFENLKKI